MIAFDAELHTYTVDGQQYPSVTELLRDLSAHEYRAVSEDVMARAAWLGSAVHKLIELDILNILDEDSLDQQLRPYLDKWRQFRAQSGFEPLLSESRVYSKRHRYAGTLDLFGRLNDKPALIDAKRCATVPRTAGPQTAGYEIALRECRPDLFETSQPAQRFALHLTPDCWRLVPFTDPNDARVFFAALTIHNFKRKAT